jgi:hypothetical protein
MEDTSLATRPSPWHQGEKALQQKAGVLDRMEVVGRRVIRDHLIDQHRQFYPQLPFIVVGAVDASGDAWATIFSGSPGFVQAPDERTLTIAAGRDRADPADEGMKDGDAVGLLGIELHTRRRNRMNGVLRRDCEAQFSVSVEQSFGNCPQYIQLRDFRFVDGVARQTAGKIETLSALDEAARKAIRAADTFFIASYSDEGSRRVDVSHRGGKAGFVRVADDGLLTIPDFAGNLFFSTLGNLLENGRAGLLFVDFATGDLLQLTGDAVILLDSPEIAAFQGAERLWTFRPRRIVRRPAVLPLRWGFSDTGWSPNSLMTGDWGQAESRLRAAELASRWRPFQVTRIVDESVVIRSFHLRPNDGAGLLPHLAGQHLPIRVTLPGADKPTIRTYTLSAAPSDGFYRISVKRDRRVSAHLHDGIEVGDVMEARAPAGGFVIDAADRRPAVLVGAGVGITPLIAMLRHIVYEGLRTRRVRPTILFHSARSKAERAFSRELAELAAAAQGQVKIVRVLSHPADATEGVDYEIAGRLDITVIRETLRLDDYDFYLCGPGGFMQTVYDGLRGINIRNARIHAEAFGPSTLQRIPDDGETPFANKSPATASTPVAFVESAKEARWEPGSGTLLDLAELRGLAPEFSCRTGTCGTCRTKLLKGAVSYLTPPTAPIQPGEVLICCSVPAAPDDGGDGSVQLAL